VLQAIVAVVLRDALSTVVPVLAHEGVIEEHEANRQIILLK
jgi:hypothetical protein